jgi:hypothetical protein
MKLLNESSNIPYEGFFWVINDSVIGVVSEVPQYNYEYSLNGKTHKNTWSNFKSDFPVNDNSVDFDYFPRGRVIVDPNYDSDGKFIDYSCMVFLDKCINNDECKKKIVDYYNLDLKSVHNISWMMLSERAGIEHYVCNNCKNK